MVDRVVYHSSMKSLKTSTGSARERILLTAHELFYRNGIRATGIDRIIAEANVTKVTFYRHFPSKNSLILEFLAYRHHRWMEWFRDAIARHGNGIAAIPSAMEERFNSENYRGCAFINSVSELGSELPEVMVATKRHKDDMTAFIRSLLPDSDHAKEDALAIALAIDGAIVHAQFDQSPEEAIHALTRILNTIRNNTCA